MEMVAGLPQAANLHIFDGVTRRPSDAPPPIPIVMRVVLGHERMLAERNRWLALAEDAETVTILAEFGADPNHVCPDGECVALKLSRLPSLKPLVALAGHGARCHLPALHNVLHVAPMAFLHYDTMMRITELSQYGWDPNALPEKYAEAVARSYNLLVLIGMLKLGKREVIRARISPVIAFREAFMGHEAPALEAILKYGADINMPGGARHVHASALHHWAIEMSHELRQVGDILKECHARGELAINQLVNGGNVLELMLAEFLMMANKPQHADRMYERLRLLVSFGFRHTSAARNIIRDIPLPFRTEIEHILGSAP